MVLIPSHHRNKLSCALERIDQERQAPEDALAKVRGSAGLTFPRPRPRPRPGIGELELSIGRSFKRSEYFQHLSWTAIRRLSNAAILSRPGWHGRRNCPAGPHNWALGRARRCRGDRRDVKGPGISVSNPSHAWSTGTEHRRSRTAPGLSRCRNPRHFHRATPHGNLRSPTWPRSGEPLYRFPFMAGCPGFHASVPGHAR